MTADDQHLAVPLALLIEDADALDREAALVAKNLPCRRSLPQRYRRAAAAIRVLARQRSLV